MPEQNKQERLGTRLPHCKYSCILWSQSSDDKGLFYSLVWFSSICEGTVNNVGTFNHGLEVRNAAIQLRINQNTEARNDLMLGDVLLALCIEKEDEVRKAVLSDSRFGR